MRSGRTGGAALQDHRHPTPPQLPLLTREGTPERLTRPNAVYSSHLARRKLLPPGADDAAAAAHGAAAEASDGGSGRASTDGGDGGGGATADSTSEKDE